MRNIQPWNMTYTLCGTSFSTVELNRNIIFKTHEDKRNAPGALICITTLGHYVGGRLVFPRYGYSAELAPRDLLICDNNKELHGNIWATGGCSSQCTLQHSTRISTHQCWNTHVVRVIGIRRLRQTPRMYRPLPFGTPRSSLPPLPDKPMWFQDWSDPVASHRPSRYSIFVLESGIAFPELVQTALVRVHPGPCRQSLQCARKK